MGEVTARSKFSCPACGAEATWDPVKRALVCGFCGTTSAANLELTSEGAEVIREHDLVQALRNIPDEARGWKAEKTQVRCQSCKAISVFDPARQAQRCDFCGSSALVPYEEVKAAFSPESMLEFRLGANDVRDRVREWIRQRWFAPSALKRSALVDTVKGVYLPYWTFDARVSADWTALAGYYYYTTETYRDSKGNTQTRQVRHVRWEPAAGHVDHFFDDELVCASKGVDPELVTKVEPFPTKELKPYHAGYVAGWVVERYQIDLGAAAQAARTRMEAETELLCSRQVPGDTQSNLRVSADYSGQTFKHILAPIWLLTYTFHGKPFQVVINGHTGTVAGHYPKSWWKIALVVLAALVAAWLLLSFAHER
ncbi:zinc ribbon domain-containing protein [Nibricoccus sp. IMCC34717]|uniref:zinc ribbon domain-containing protein n=1 Tax=Nibricoccus sp. IMCC34717 TaxID=3034021 RepID=UPI00384DCEA9